MASAAVMAAVMAEETVVAAREEAETAEATVVEAKAEVETVEATAAAMVVEKEEVGMVAVGMVAARAVEGVAEVVMAEGAMAVATAVPHSPRQHSIAPHEARSSGRIDSPAYSRHSPRLASRR